MWKTALSLIISALIICFCSYYFGDPLSGEQFGTLTFLVITMIVVAMFCFIISEITHNCSQVDKLWSILPIFYTFIVFYNSHWNVRVGIMFFLVLIWGLRLSYNFSRRGGYHLIPWKGEEDYRWSVLRQKPGLNTVWGWRFFNLFFISFYQNGLILFLTLPILVAWQGTKPLHYFDFLIGLAVIAFIILEAVADQQQYIFQKNKKEMANNGSFVGFCQTGLWSYSRHPNYLAEQAIWILFYLFSVSATGKWINWSIVGCLLLLLLFKGSSDFSEKISSDKYPEYQKYKSQVPRFIPHFRQIKKNKS